MNCQARAISPLEGRYQKKTSALSEYFSELALMRSRLEVEVEYFLALLPAIAPSTIKLLTAQRQAELIKLYQNFSQKDFGRIKKIEEKTKHDIKAVEYFFKEKLVKTEFREYKEYAHFALTSEDINNIANSLMWKKAIQDIYLPLITKLHREVRNLAVRHRIQPLLSLTHGQSASPTTLGKEMAVFAVRLERKVAQLRKHEYLGKFSGATGTWGAHHIAFPKVNWIKFSAEFIKSFGLKPNLITTQIEPHDSLVESYQIISHTNSILINFCRDIWTYISRGIFKQKKIEQEVGSSAMPHKINPIQFENAEGNLGVANALLEHFISKLTVSRLQRDLSDSTVIRNQGAALAHSLIACESILEGLSRLTINEIAINEELESHWEVLSEPAQIILKKMGSNRPYEKFKKLMRGIKIDRLAFQEIAKKLNISPASKKILMELTPHSYIGLCKKIKF